MLKKSADEDYQKYLDNGNAKNAFIIQTKIDNDESYKDKIVEFIKSNAPANINDSNFSIYAESKLSDIKNTSLNLNDDDKQKIIKSNDDDNISNIKQSSNNDLDDYKKAINSFIDESKIDDKDRIDRVQLAMDSLLKNPKKFDAACIEYFDEGEVKSKIPQFKLSQIKDSNHFSSQVKNKLLSQTKTITQHANQLGNIANKSIQQFKEYNVKNFIKEAEKVKKNQQIVSNNLSIKEKKHKSLKI